MAHKFDAITVALYHVVSFPFNGCHATKIGAFLSFQIWLEVWAVSLDLDQSNAIQ